jgi:hypothetical protein
MSHSKFLRGHVRKIYFLAGKILVGFELPYEKNGSEGPLSDLFKLLVLLPKLLHTRM